MKVPFCLLTFASATCLVAAFAPSSHQRVTCSVRTTRLYSEAEDKGDDWAIIKAEEDVEEEWDLSVGGVGLAMDSAIRMSGSVGSKGGEAEATGMALYTQLTALAEADARATMDKAGVTLICSGLGKELYKDPGMTTTREIVYGPSDAVRGALSSVPNASVSSAKSVVLNFLGGDDLIVDEVLDACGLMVQGLDISDKARVTFNSLCHNSIPSGTASVTVVATGDTSKGGEGGLSGLEKAIAEGEMYFHQGNWYTVIEDDVSNDQY